MGRVADPGQQGTSLANAEDFVREGQQEARVSRDISRICQRCKLPLRDGEKIARIIGQVIHTHTIQCVIRLRAALDDCYGQRES